MSYVIKNCPAYDSSIVEWNCLGSDCTECEGGHCILKQIVEECKRVTNNFNSGKHDKDSHEAYFGMCDMAEIILSMLEIEKCEE